MLIINIHFGQLLSCADKRIVNNIIMKVYVERNSMSVKLIRFRKKYRLYSHLGPTFAKGGIQWKSSTFATDVVFTHGNSFQHVYSRAHCSHGKSLQKLPV